MATVFGGTMWRYVQRHVWKLACRYDHVEVDSMFVVFSKRNPYDLSYDQISKVAEIQQRIIYNQC